MAIFNKKFFSRRTQNTKKTKWIPWKSKNHPSRAVLKDGHINVTRTKLSKIRWWRYFQDIFTTLVDAQWRWILGFIALEFFGCWLSFTLLWWLIAFVHGDLQEAHLPPNQKESGWKPCVYEIHGFHSAFLYSLETQHTTGYGLRAISEECPEAIFILVCQCLIGMTLDSFSISIIFAKMMRAKYAHNTIQFSRNAVISQRNGNLCLMFRVGDLRRSYLAGIGIRAILVKSKRTEEGEDLPLFQTELELTTEDGPSSLFLLWPTILYHEINDDSPLLDLVSPQLMKNHKLEIIVVFDATVESTGVSIEAKSSYLAHEILWSQMFDQMVSYNSTMNCYEVDWDKFDSTRPVLTPVKNFEEFAPDIYTPLLEIDNQQQEEIINVEATI